MDSFYVLRDVMAYVETHLREEITAEEIARSCHYSVSNLKYLFQKVFQYSIIDYVNRRKVTEAAGELLQTKKTVCEIAFSYGFRSQEVFSRVFKRIWQETPGSYRKHHRFWRLFPAQEFLCDESGVFRRRFDLRALREDLLRGEWRAALCFDVIGIRQIKAHYGREAGEAAVLHALWRLEAALGEHGEIYRIAGDKFVLLLADKFGEKAFERMKEILRRVFERNGEEIWFHGYPIAVSMFAGWTSVEKEDGRAENLFECLDWAIFEAKQRREIRFMKGEGGSLEFYWDEDAGMNRGRASGCRPVKEHGLEGFGMKAAGAVWEQRCCVVLPQEDLWFQWKEKKRDFSVFFPDGKGWYRRVVYQEDGTVLREHYYVMKDKKMCGTGEITYLELYLELVRERNGEQAVLNQGELKEALYDGRISKEEYKWAWKVIRELQENL